MSINFKVFKYEQRNNNYLELIKFDFLYDKNFKFNQIN